MTDLASPALPSHGAARATSANFEVGVMSAPIEASVAATRAALAAKGYGDSELFAVARAAAAGLALAFAYTAAKKDLDTPGRPWMDDTTVGREYDAWTEEMILEYYWGEHIHLGYYNDEVMRKGAGTLLGHKAKDFVEAKLDFVEEMAVWAGCGENTPRTVLDVGCGIGGASRHLAKGFGVGTDVTGITLSPKQVQRATDLAAQQGIPNVNFRVMNALAMEFPDNSFDLVWACESGEHMPDKRQFVSELTRVVKPGGRVIIVTWCHRDLEAGEEGLRPREERLLRTINRAFYLPRWCSVDGTGKMQGIGTDDWTTQTIASWRASVWAGVWDPLPVFSKPKVWYKTVRDIVCLERMHRAFDNGLMQYGMIKATKASR